MSIINMRRAQRSFYLKNSSKRADFDNSVYLNRVMPTPEPFLSPASRAVRQLPPPKKLEQSRTPEGRPGDAHSHSPKRTTKKVFMGDLIKNFGDLQKYVIEIDLLPYYQAMLPKSLGPVDELFLVALQPYLGRYQSGHLSKHLEPAQTKLTKESLLVQLKRTAGKPSQFQALLEQVLPSEQFREQVFTKLLEEINWKCGEFKVRVRRLFSIRKEVTNIMDLDLRDDYLVVGEHIANFRELFNRWKETARTQYLLNELCERYAPGSLPDSRVASWRIQPSRRLERPGSLSVSRAVSKNQSILLREESTAKKKGTGRTWYNELFDSLKDKYEVRVEEIVHLFHEFKTKFIRQSERRFGVTLSELSEEDVLKETIDYELAREGELDKVEEVVQRLMVYEGWRHIQPSRQLTFRDYAVMHFTTSKRLKQEYTSDALVSYLDPEAKGEIGKADFCHWVTQSLHDLRAESRRMLGDVMFQWFKKNSFTYSTSQGEVLLIDKLRDKGEEHQLFYRYIYQLI